ncbi:extracellular solute-binding protein [Acinetobacter courvalinii]|uniref:extracellular solute-binding protein n=1 Tax=Acinetobacter courvalinii TaxID=280147 RepID=UPI0021CF1552|nr:extracellular solute-binding protein [Acinetobacter courvalinii]MCU4367761.1 extracellular solute-binding protein [Acinetobacter courvalinii]MCU4445967.1 extracellular solute-binding protein [Acinetobacter courvalinii]
MNSLLCIKRLSLCYGLSLFAPLSFAVIHTTSYLAMHVQPKYAQLKAMPYANPNAPKGGVLSQSSLGTFDNLNSMNGKGSSTEGVNYLFDSLMDRSLDEPRVMYPLLAEKVSYDPDHLQSITFHLNPKARFNNGQPLTAEDVKFTFDTYQSKANLGFQMYLSDLARTEVLSRHQVKFIFKSRHNVEMPLIVASLPIYSKLDWKNKDFSRVTLHPIVGSGPYMVERIDAGRSITYKRSPNYWAKDLPVNKGRYNFDRLKYVYYRNLEVSFEGFKSRQFNLYEEKNIRNWVTSYHFPAAKAGLVKRYKARLATPLDIQSLVFNIRRKPLNDIHLRQALTYAYDFEWQNKALFFNQNQRLQSYFDNTDLAATGRPSAAELKVLQPYLVQLNPLMQQGVLADWRYPVSDASGFNRNNLLIAQKLLKAAGYVIRDGKLYDRTGKAIQIELLMQQENPQRELMPFVRNLKRLGIQVNLRQVDVPQYMERIRRQDFDMMVLKLPQTLTPGKEQAQFWGSAAADEAGNYNYSGIKNPVIDQMIEKIVRAKTREEVVLYTRVLDRLLRAGYYQILTYGKPERWFAYWDIYQQPSVKPKLSVGWEYWWVDADQAKKQGQSVQKH